MTVLKGFTHSLFESLSIYDKPKKDEVNSGGKTKIPLKEQVASSL